MSGPFPFVRTVIRHAVVASTNDEARALAHAGAIALPALIRADRQTQGRGRGAHSWWSDEGSLTFTLLLDPAAHALRPEHEPRLALTVAVAVIDAIEARSALPALGIRWPNDIESAGRKLGGLLPERIATDHGPRLALGIGLNVRTRFDDAPAEVRRRAVALAEVADGFDKTDGFLGALLERFERRLVALSRDNRDLSERWAALDTLRGLPIRVALGDRIIEGSGQGITEEGALRLWDGRETHVLFGGQVLRD